MNSEFSFLLSPSVATILASYNCTAACEHCCFDSHPGIKERISLDQMLKFINESSKIKSIKLVVFSGGECFLLGSDLDIAIKAASDMKLATRCVTNGYWAKTYERAYDRMMELKEAGLNELNISTGDFHQKFVPQEYVINAALASVNLNIPVVIMIELQKERKVTAEELRKDKRIRNLMMTDANKLFRIVESPWMPMSHKEIIQQDKRNLLSRDNVHRKKGCKSILTTVVATPKNQLGICCGLSREFIPELNVDIPSEYSLEALYYKTSSDFMKIWLYIDGPEKILSWASSIDQSIDWEWKYSHICHACLAIFNDDKVRKVIKENYAGKVDEILLKYSMVVRSGKGLSPELTDTFAYKA